MNFHEFDDCCDFHEYQDCEFHRYDDFLHFVKSVNLIIIFNNYFCLIVNLANSVTLMNNVNFLNNVMFVNFMDVMSFANFVTSINVVNFTNFTIMKNIIFVIFKMWFNILHEYCEFQGFGDCHDVKYVIFVNVMFKSCENELYFMALWM